MDTLLPVADLAILYHVRPGTIRGWISEEKITGTRSGCRGGSKLYPLDAVQRAYDRRHPEQP